MIQNGQIGNKENNVNNGWEQHPYLKAHPEILDGATDREIRALRADGILDYMAIHKLKSGVYTQSRINAERKAARKGAIDTMTTEDVKLFVADIQSGLPTVGDKTVDLMLIDPLYDADHVHLLSVISMIAERVLKDDGNMLVLYGNRHLPEAMQRLSEHMQYYWTLAYLTPAGGSPPLQWLHVGTHFKPVLWYRKKGMPYKGDMIYDVINTGKPLKRADKTFIYQQDVQGMAAIIEQLTDPGDTVMDCMCGSGTTGEAALKLGRKVILCDINSERVEESRARIMKVLSGV